MDRFGTGLVCTVDVEEIPDRPVDPRIRHLLGSSTDPEVVAEVKAMAASAERVMVLLDSDHSCEHVTRELELDAELVTPGCYLIVEDTNINGHPVVPDFDPGPAEALERFSARDDRFEVDDAAEKRLFTFNPDGFLRRRMS